MAFKRFTARRGLCSIIYSDNVKTFKAAERELRALWSSMNHPDVKNFFSSKRIKW